MAQYMREPLLVLDVNEHEDAHVQRYMYKSYRLENGSDHESGYVEALSDRDARYAELLDPSYEWRDSINRLAPGEDIDLQEVNLLERGTDIDAVVIKSRPMDERLRIVLARRGLPTLNKQELDERLLDATVCTEEQLIHEAYGIDVYASNSQSDDNDSRHSSRPIKRASRMATGTLLKVPTSGYFDSIHSTKSSLMTDPPLSYLVRPIVKDLAGLGIPAMKRTQTDVKTIREWLLGKPRALRHLFAYLPYPELQAKMWPHTDLLAWGKAEIHQEQTISALRLKLRQFGNGFLENQARSGISSLTSRIQN
ncbi:hypothetical protein PHMEG_00027301 [Phytophthora megakarya]|uniref:Uncharacterized protein n=1 Tax=Phytophthora megakarya TaxID=4795 RepID=A0A225V7J3_9STRA|nr:hypothetical protein PHMEG_00027301 [Phytophthora megakarya]